MEVSWRLEQIKAHKTTFESFQPVCLSISEALEIKLGTSRHNNREYYILRSSSPAKLNILVNYLDSYPLFSAKHLDYID